MAQDGGQSAEKDLLKLIENPQEAAELQKKAKEEKSAQGPVAASSVGQAPKRQTISFNPVQFLTNRRNLIALLIVAIVLVSGYLVFSAISEYQKLQKAKNFENFLYVVNGQEQKIGGRASSAESVSGAAAEVEDHSIIRNIFKPGAPKEQDKKKDSAIGSLQDYKLVGISLEADPVDSYAMVENTRTKTTFFAKKGERIEGMELLEITENKLVFKSQGQTVELR